MQISSLCVSEVTPDINTELMGVTYDESLVAPGARLPLALAIENTGNEDIDEITVEITTEYEDYYAVTLENMNLGRGETKTYTLTDFELPTELLGPVTFYVSVAAEEESDYENNAFDFTVGYVDLEVTATNMLVSGQNSVNIIVKNLSNLSTNAILRISADEETGAVLFEKPLADLSKDNSSTILVNLDRLDGQGSVTKFYISVVAEKEELLKSDNQQILYMARTRETLYNLNVTSGVGGYVTGDVGGSFAPGEEITLSVVTEDKYRFVHWVSNCELDWEDSTATTVTFTMPSENVSITAVFEDMTIYTWLNEEELFLLPGETFQLQLYYNNPHSIPFATVWHSSDPSVATVDENGLVTAVSGGTAEITAYSDNAYVQVVSCGVSVPITNIVTNVSQLESAHTYADYVSDNNATYKADGTKTAKCDFCEATDTLPDPGSKLANTAINYYGVVYYFNASGICTNP